MKNARNAQKVKTVRTAGQHGKTVRLASQKVRDVRNAKQSTKVGPVVRNHRRNFYLPSVENRLNVITVVPVPQYNPVCIIMKQVEFEIYSPGGRIHPVYPGLYEDVASCESRIVRTCRLLQRRHSTSLQ